MLVVFLSFDAVLNKLQYHDGEIFLCLPQKLVKAQPTFQTTILADQTKHPHIES